MPSANLLGVVELDNHCLVFHKKGQDGSSKCNLVCTDGEFDRVFGAIYEMDSTHKQALDHFEGNGNGYYDTQLTVELHGKEHSCFTYFAQPSYIENDLKPYHWYKDLVVLGARHLQFPDAYVELIEKVESVEDPNEIRRIQQQKLIEQILQYSS